MIRARTFPRSDLAAPEKWRGLERPGPKRSRSNAQVSGNPSPDPLAHDLPRGPSGRKRASAAWFTSLPRRCRQKLRGRIGIRRQLIFELHGLDSLAGFQADLAVDLADVEAAGGELALQLLGLLGARARGCPRAPRRMAGAPSMRVAR